MRTTTTGRAATTALAMAVVGSLAMSSGPPDTAPSTQAAGDPVVIAVVDDGLNVLHPAFQRRDDPAAFVHPSERIGGYPSAVPAAPFPAGGDDWRVDLASGDTQEAMAVLGTNRLAWVPGTNVVGAVTLKGDPHPLMDHEEYYGHGTKVASVAVGAGLTELEAPLSPAPEALLVLLDTSTLLEADTGQLTTPPQNFVDQLLWAAEQPWIDIVNLSLGHPVTVVDPTPDQAGYLAIGEAVSTVIASGKLVVVAAGNDAVSPQFDNPFSGPPGSLVVGANDNCGPTVASNTFPHVVADGAAVHAADPFGYDQRLFSGTSAAAPRVAAFAAQVLADVRARTGPREPGTLASVPADRRPSRGPLADDGILSAGELQSVLRASATPGSTPSRYDGVEGFGDFACLPIPDTNPDGSSLYAKIGYGEVHEGTITDAVDVVLGRTPSPPRPHEDEQYAHTEHLRRASWG